MVINIMPPVLPIKHNLFDQNGSSENQPFKVQRLLDKWHYKYNLHKSCALCMMMSHLLIL